VVDTEGQGMAGCRAVTNQLPAERVEVPDRVVGRVGMSSSMREATFALAEALFTTDEGPPPEERLAWLCDDLDHFLAHAGPRAKLSYWLCLTAISLVAPLMIGRLPPLRGLSREDRARALERLERSPLGLAVFGGKAILCIIYYEHPDAARLVGHDGKCLGETA
jgi:hypothetical protein